METNRKKFILVGVIILALCAAITGFFYSRNKIRPKSPGDEMLRSSTLVQLSESFLSIGAAAERISIENAEPVVRSYSEDRTHFIIENFPCVKQLPELPTGCEITSLCTVLNFYGFSIDKVTLSNAYMKKIPVGSDYPTVGFWGDPTENGTNGCYAPVISDAANKFFTENGASYAAVNLTGTDLSRLLLFLDRNQPLILWTTTGLQQPTKAGSFTMPDGKQFSWYMPFHCVVVYGYDLEEGLLYAADPLSGPVTYDYSLFQKRYSQMGSQAVLCYPIR